MEAKGQVNQYVPYKRSGKSVFTLNVSTGVTPFMLVLDGKEYASNCYRVEAKIILVTKVWYRPTVEEFCSLTPDMQGHVLNGGLIHGPFGRSGIADDPTTPTTSYEEFQAWCLATYGTRIS